MTAALIRAAQYVRMSTEHQQYSIENQADAIAAYAAQRGMAVVRTFSDAGRSGLRLEGREGLRELIALVEGGRADFEAVLVYDVSRWGRFQDTDESAYYEYLCRRAGLAVHYCAEPFANDGSLLASLVKTVKRAMAGEYSRELSAKVSRGQCRLIELGYRQGGPAGYGLRRMLVNAAGEPRGVLGAGEQKSLQTDRVILVPGPPEEVEVVRRIFRMFVEERADEATIATALVHDGIVGCKGRPWTRGRVRAILTQAKYAGHNVYNRVSFKLKQRRVRNAPEQWVRRDGAFEAVVEPATFAAAQELLRARRERPSDEAMMVGLRALAARHDRLSAALIDRDEALPSSAAYRQRFGSLAGYTPERDDSYLAANLLLHQLRPAVVTTIMEALRRRGLSVARDPATDVLTVAGNLRVTVVMARYTTTAAGSPRWLLRPRRGGEPDLTIAVRVDATHAAPLDYFLLPRLDVDPARLRLAEDNGLRLDAYRADALDDFAASVAPVPLEVAA